MREGFSGAAGRGGSRVTATAAGTRAPTVTSFPKTNVDADRLEAPPTLTSVSTPSDTLTDRLPQPVQAQLPTTICEVPLSKASNPHLLPKHGC